MIAAGTIAFFLLLIIELIWDYEKWKRKPFDHKDKWVRGVLLMPSVALLGWQLPGPLLFGLFYAWLLICLSYWTLFDGLFNVIRRLPWSYVGVPDPWDPKLDKLQRQYPWISVVKIIFSLGLIAGYVAMVI